MSATETVEEGERPASDVDEQPDRDLVPQLEPLGRTHPVLDRDDVAAVLRPERGRPLGIADLDRDRDHPPAVRHDRRRSLELAALVLGNRHEVVRRRPLPEPDLAAEVEVHRTQHTSGARNETPPRTSRCKLIPPGVRGASRMSNLRAPVALLAIVLVTACGSSGTAGTSASPSHVGEFAASPSSSLEASLEPIPSPYPSPAPSVAAASPQPTPTPAPTRKPTPTRTPKPTPIAWSDAEEALLGAIRPEAATDCKPRRSGLPDRAVAGIECGAGVPFVARVGAYKFTNNDDMYATYLERMAEYGVTPFSGGCYAGTSGDQSWGASFSPDDESKPWAHMGCYLDENNIANVRVTCEHAVYIGLLGRNSDMRVVYSWAMRTDPSVGGNAGYGAPPTICAGGADTY